MSDDQGPNLPPPEQLAKINYLLLHGLTELLFGRSRPLMQEDFVALYRQAATGIGEMPEAKAFLEAHATAWSEVKIDIRR